MAYTGGWLRTPTDIMEHILECRWYYQDEEALEKLHLVAQHIDNPQRIKELEEEWLYGSRKWKTGSGSNGAKSRADKSHWWDNWWKD